MQTVRLRPGLKVWSALSLTALTLAVLCGMVSPAQAGSVALRDEAGVLSSQEKQSIQDAASSAPFDVTVWTVKGGYSSRQDFYSAVNGLAGGRRVVVGVDTVDRYSHIATRQNTGLTRDNLDAATTSANASFRQKQWGAGIVSALGALVQSAPSRSGRAVGQTNGNQAAAGSYGGPAPTEERSSGGFNLFSFLPILIVIGVFMMIAKRFMRGPATGYPGQGYAGQTMNQPGYRGGPNQPGYYPGGMAPGGYGGAYNQGSGGMNPLVAGGLGAAGGGLLGYELGKAAGEREGTPSGSYDNGGYSQQNSDNNDPGGLVQSDPGSSGSTDFGGGDSGGGDFGGGDFGGGDSGGGGGDF